MATAIIGLIQKESQNVELIQFKIYKVKLKFTKNVFRI
jgi:hypothetical protein